ncbi:MAG: penicillin binding protein PBP4B [Lachnospiraceae bacterium]|nr:penicillin binding protein PBP4B [Lachnospiraceae bacterium]
MKKILNHEYASAGTMARAVAVGLCMSLFASGMAGCAGGAESPGGPVVEDIETPADDGRKSVSSGNGEERDMGEISVSETVLPEMEWQKEYSFPDHAGYTDDTLVMNSTGAFTAYPGQGSVYVTPSSDINSFDMFINDVKIQTDGMEPGKSYEVSFPGVAVSGINSLQISGLSPSSATVKVNIPYPVIRTPGEGEVFVDQECLRLIEDIVSSDIEYGFTAAQIAVVKDGSLVYENAWGKLNSYAKDGTRLEDGDPVTVDTLFDLASNTKMYSVAYGIQYLVAGEQLQMDTRISDILGESFYQDTIEIHYAGFDPVDLETNKKWKKELTIRDVMCHRAGFPVTPGYLRDKYDHENGTYLTDKDNILYAGADGSPETREKTLSMICKTPLKREPGTKIEYSDVDYMLLCFCIEKVTGKRLDQFLKETFWDPMGLERICYNPLENGFSVSDCAATELNGNTRDGTVDFKGIRTDTIQGEVHDESAYYSMGGVSGHAGMFSNASDLARLASVMLTGGYGEKRFFSKDVVDAFCAPQTDTDANWGVGWYREGDGRRPWYFSEEASSSAVGHQGWTGTLTVIDPEEQLVVVVLTNKRNTPLTDKEKDSGKFDGNWYTTATLGFVPQIIYKGIGYPGADRSEELYSLLGDMVRGKFRIIENTAAKAAETGSGRRVDADHPVVRAAYSLMDVYLKWSSERGYGLSDEKVQEMFKLLDSERDSEEIGKLQEKYK